MFSTIFILLINNHVPSPTHMATLIQKVSQQEGVDPIAMTKIVITESRGNATAINWKTGDYGLMQINHKSHPKVSMSCALNTECGLRAGAKILKSTRRLCAFNLGNTGALKFPKACSQYEQKLASLAK